MAKYIPKHSAPPRRGRFILPVLLAAVVLAGSLAAVSWNSSAKYTKEHEEQAVAKIVEFYFGSDLLVPGGKSYTLNPGSEEFSFELRNFDGLKASELTVNYTVTVSGPDGSVIEIKPHGSNQVSSTAGGSLVNGGEGKADIVTVSGPDGSVIEIKPHGSNQVSSTAGGSLVNGGEGKADIVTVSGLVDGGVYTVTAVGNSKMTEQDGEGYTATLSATFTVSSEETNIYKNTSYYEDYVLLTLWTKNKAGEFVITLPNGLIPDKTYPGYTSAGYTADNPISLGENQSLVLRYFITNEYNGSTITVNNNLEETPLS